MPGALANPVCGTFDPPPCPEPSAGPKTPPPLREPLDLVLAALCATFPVSRHDLLSPRRHADIAWPRHIGMAALHETFELSLRDAARAFRRSCHGTVLHAQRTVRTRTTTSTRDRTAVQTFRDHLTRLRAL